jgi:hypothetical protein
LPALLLALLLHAGVATSPLLVTSDAVFHANKLAQVARGDLFPTSLTQHERPFRFPYGVAFYALLAPLSHAGIGEIALVRWGAAVAGFAASLATFALLVGRPPLAAAAVMLLQLFPLSVDVYSYGNLSNAFGQAATVLFFAWWTGSARGGAAAGALLFVLAGLAHLSSLVVLVVLAGALALARGRGLLGDPTRALALAVGLALAGAYYASFAPLVLEQLPRLREGGGQGGVARAPWSLLWEQARTAVQQWGWPALALCLIGRPWRADGGLERDLRAFWVAGGVLLLAALLTPLEVRYRLALTLPLAVAGASGLLRLWSGGVPRRALAVVLLALQAALAWRASVEALLVRYRG